jgi:hypothetical protein
MSRPSNMSIAPHVRRVAITIPASAGAAENRRDLIVAALNAVNAGEGDQLRPFIMGARIWIVATAYVVGDSLTSLPGSVAIGQTYDEPAADFAQATYVKSSGAAIANACVSVYIAAR